MDLDTEALKKRNEDLNSKLQRLVGEYKNLIQKNKELEISLTGLNNAN